MTQPLTSIQTSENDRPLVLVVEDDARMAEILTLSLSGEGYRTAVASTGGEAITAAFEQKPSVVLLDLGLPDIDGVEVARHVREFSRVPIVVLSVRSDEHDIVQALDHGANDYLTKPFRERELFARLRAALRSASFQPTESWSLGGMHVDPVRRRVTIEGREVALSRTEYKVLAVLARAGGAVVTHGQILREVWGPNYEREVGYLRVYVHHLREKLEPNPGSPRFLLTEPGVGYRFGVN